MSEANLGRWLRTVRHLRGRQVAGQILHRLRPPRAPRSRARPAPALAVARPFVPFLPAPAAAWSDGGLRFRLRNREVAFEGHVDWDFADAGPLWAFDLHAFDWARRPALAPGPRRALLLDWIERHPDGVGWNAHPTSLRALAWTKLLATPGALGADAAPRMAIQASLARQLDHLSRNLETHLLANHYLWNLLALTAAGIALDGPGAERWRGHEARLLAELLEQVPRDGLHCERSPMYHALVLEAVLDARNLLRARDGGAAEGASSRLGVALEDAAARMLGALEVLTHPDGEIALFGDAAIGVAQPPGALRDYARELGVEPRGPATPGLLPDGGYARLDAGAFTLIASVAGPAPPHQPGHAHCDALAFELSFDGERVVTDTGVHEYIPGPLRDLSRATRSHATLEVGGCDQAELWAAHRVGGRPQVALEAMEDGKRIAASCAGYATPNTRHVRVWELDAAGLTVHDALEGAPRRARLALPLAPGLEPRLDGARARVRLAGGTWLRLELSGGPPLRVVRSPYFPEFGRRIDRAVLVAEADPWPRTTLRIEAARTLR